MKAFASVMLAAALLFPLVLLTSVTEKAGAQVEEVLAGGRAAEANYYAGEAAMNAAFSSMRGAAGERRPMDARSVRETLVEIGERLAGLEAFLESGGEGGGVDVDFWCGAFSGSERRGLVEKMAIERRALKCDSCFDASARVVFAGADVAERKPVMKSVSACALFAALEPGLFGGRVGAGNSLLVHSVDDEGNVLASPELVAAGITPVSPAAIGVSIYDGRTGAASISYIAAGEMREY